MKKPDRIITKREQRPCGCIVTEYADPPSPMLAPCVPCGLHAVANALDKAAMAQHEAAQALAAVATTIRSAEHAVNMDAISRAVASGPKGLVQ